MGEAKTLLQSGGYKWGFVVCTLVLCSCGEHVDVGSFTRPGPPMASHRHPSHLSYCLFALCPCPPGLQVLPQTTAFCLLLSRTLATPSSPSSPDYPETCPVNSPPKRKLLLCCYILVCSSLCTIQRLLSRPPAGVPVAPASRSPSQPPTQAVDSTLHEGSLEPSTLLATTTSNKGQHRALLSTVCPLVLRLGRGLGLRLGRGNRVKVDTGPKLMGILRG